VGSARDRHVVGTTKQEGLLFAWALAGGVVRAMPSHPQSVCVVGVKGVLEGVPIREGAFVKVEHRVVENVEMVGCSEIPPFKCKKGGTGPLVNAFGWGGLEELFPIVGLPLSGCNAARQN
jgi:hypothetical protein